MGRARRAWLWGGDGRRRRADGSRYAGRYVRWRERADGGYVGRSRCFSTGLDRNDLAAAKAFVAELNNRLQGISAPITRLTLDQAVQRFLKGCAALSLASQHEYAVTLGLLVKRVGADISLGTVTSDDLDGFVAWRMGQSRPATVAKHVRGMRRFFGWAVQRRYIVESPVDGLSSRPRTGQVRQIRVPTDQEKARLVRCCPPKFRLAVQLAMTTGMDRRMLAGLQPQHVDLAGRCVRFARPKTNVPILAPIHADLLKPLGRLLAGKSQELPLFPGLMHRTWWHAARERAGLDELTFADLRKLASLWLQRALPPFAVAGILGHAGLATTARYYSPADPEQWKRIDGLPLPGRRAGQPPRPP